MRTPRKQATSPAHRQEASLARRQVMSLAHGRVTILFAVFMACAALATLVAGTATAKAAEALPDDGGASWRLEQPSPPEPPPGVPRSEVPVGLGRIGDLEFWAPNRGLLITAGNGSTIPPGVWAYDGEGWHELTTVCGATEGRIAWAGPDEFWTISDGRPGQAANPANGEPAPIADDTLCHFAGGQVVGSYASPAFEASSYQPMDAAGCIGASDCWFAGEPLPEPQVGAFHLHWDGRALSEQPNPQGHAVKAMRLFAGHLYESVKLAASDLLTEPEPSPPPVLHRIQPAGQQPTFVSLTPHVPEYATGEFPEALDYLRLSADEEALWGAAGPAPSLPEHSNPAEVTVVRYAKDAWSQVLGPFADPPSGSPFPADVIEGIAAEPGGESAWLALEGEGEAAGSSPTASATLARVSADGQVSDVQTLPAGGEGVGPKGAAKLIACPAPHDCWMATTQGWLFHLSDGSALERDADPAFAGLITYRPPDEGLPQTPADLPPIDDSGLVESIPSESVPVPEAPKPPQRRREVPLLTHLHERLLHGSTLRVSFRLAVKARVRLVAKRRRSVVAATVAQVLPAGARRLLLRLDRQRWPTKLSLQTHALAPLPTVPVQGGGEGEGGNTVALGVASLPASYSPLWTGPSTTSPRVWAGPGL